MEVDAELIQPRRSRERLSSRSMATNTPPPTSMMPVIRTTTKLGKFM
jgi:hypothetical protein